MPTGDPERFFLVIFKLLNTIGENEIVHEIEYRIGEKWEWYPIAKKVFDNNLLPKEECTFNFQYILSNEGPYYLTR